jgi:hypothetical protein
MTECFIQVKNKNLFREWPDFFCLSAGTNESMSDPKNFTAGRTASFQASSSSGKPEVFITGFDHCESLSAGISLLIKE